jgi:putative aldouronate transport system permease protein
VEKKIKEKLSKEQKERKKSKIFKKVWENRALYVFLLPMLIFFGVFYFSPLWGLQIAFKDFKPGLGIAESPWVGLKYIRQFIDSYYFGLLLKNTLTISLYGLIVNFPIAILMALVIQYIPRLRFKKLTQVATYAPHFISTVVLSGMLFVFLAPSSGIINNLIVALGGEAIDFMGSARAFPHLYVWSGVWQNAGWNSIIYIAALTGISPELHEAAIVDGASKLQRVRYIDLPSILPTAIIMLIMDCGRVMSIGYEKALLMQTSSNLEASQIISTYVYEIGIKGSQFSYSAAIGLFNNVINCILLLLVNRIARRVTGSSLW